MNTFTNVFRKLGFVILCVSMISSRAQATTFTAMMSGDFNAAATWGGIAPATTVLGDIVIIPPGITVTMNTDATFSTASSLVVNGTLTSGTYATTLLMSGGSLAGSGNVTVDSMDLGTSTALTFTGTITAQGATSYGSTISTTAGITIVNVLRLGSGVLSFTSGNLTMSPGSSIIVSGGSMAASGAGTVNLTYPYDVWYTTTAATAGIELSGTGLRNVDVNVPGAVTMSGNVQVNGTLSLTSGNLSLNGNALTFSLTGDLSASGMGAIYSTATSDVVINATNSLSGTLKFAAGGNTLHNLTLNFGNNASSVNLGSYAIVNGDLGLMSGKIVLGAYNLAVAAGGTVSGGTTNSYVVTNGVGAYARNLAASASAKFDVGTTLTSYSPVIITANSGSATGDVSVNAVGNVYANGMSGTSLSATQPVVNNTWHVASTAAAFNYDMQAMWTAGMEVNGFDRNQAYISHYTGGAWDVKAGSAATLSAGMYSITRAGITSLSPFMVSDVNRTTTSVNPVIYAATEPIKVYPNPAVNTLYFEGNAGMEKAYIISMDGRVVSTFNGWNKSVSVSDLQAGIYSIYFVGQDSKEGLQFVKE